MEEKIMDLWNIVQVILDISLNKTGPGAGVIIKICSKIFVNENIYLVLFFFFWFGLDDFWVAACQWDIGVGSETLAGITADPHFLPLFAPNAPQC